MTTYTIYTIYTDGACINNGKADARAGWGAVLCNPEGDVLELAGQSLRANRRPTAEPSCWQLSRPWRDAPSPRLSTSIPTASTSPTPATAGYLTGKPEAGGRPTRGLRSISTCGSVLTSNCKPRMSASTG